MKRSLVLAPLSILALFLATTVMAEETEEAELAARQAWALGNHEEALRQATAAITAAPGKAEGDLLRAEMEESLGRHEEAVADLTLAIERSPPSANLYDRRGAERFKLGDMPKSLADFDRAIELQPARAPHHWMRGITCYYTGKYEEGASQFAAYQTTDDNDVENAVWHFLCVARARGLDSARKELMRTRHDPRVPLDQIYMLFAGTGGVREVMAAVEAENVSNDEANDRRFYANLYLGLYHDVTGELELARREMDLAANHFPFAHYMKDVAKVHLKSLDDRKNSRSDHGSQR